MCQQAGQAGPKVIGLHALENLSGLEMAKYGWAGLSGPNTANSDLYWKIRN